MNFFIGHPYIMVGLLGLGWLFFSFPSILWIIIIGIVLLGLWKFGSIFIPFFIN